MGLIPVNNVLTPADVAEILADIDKIRQKFSNYHVNFTPEERKKSFVLGQDRESFVDQVVMMATQHEVVVPVDVDLDHVKMLYDFIKDLKLIKTNKSDIDSLIDNLYINVGILLLSSVNRIYRTASTLAKKGNYPFNDLVKTAGKIYEKSPRISGTKYTIEPSGHIKIGKIVRGSRFVDCGKTVLTFTYGDEVLGRFKKDETYTVNPGNSLKIPVGYDSIVVYNMSNDQSGEFSVKIKK